jgi:hypothetical protein
MQIMNRMDKKTHKGMREMKEKCKRKQRKRRKMGRREEIKNNIAFYVTSFPVLFTSLR